ncbi:hypothetical protein JCGZ_21193 [Jatropha curcas]|uniref:Leucine-rich repeat-containing N-terminal plant-type domain-containing protein n=1 Tax=Jatropha curcas TaxID=180498 RepID=A0A067JAF4_JATCU|nr:probable inactive receptor kinase At2g26730 [Jatropha curcas]KDP20722.1 hypothetical protein JCGZ_21193 [Jatropha curcas]
MDRIPFSVFLILMFLLVNVFPMSNSVEENVKQALVQFMDKLSEGNDNNLGWNVTSDPCTDGWVGVTCDSKLQTVKKIVVDEFNLTGTIDASSLCEVNSLVILSLRRNYIVGFIPDEIGNCKILTHLYISDNRISGRIPDGLLQLRNLKRLDISNNYLSDNIPTLSGISGLLSFLAQGNQLRGIIPDFSFSNLLQEFNVSNNELSGRIPDILSNFSAASFSGNAGLCGKPLSNACPPSPPPASSPFSYF